MIRIELSVLRDFFFHTNWYDDLCLAVLNRVSYFIPVAVAKYSDQKQLRGGKGYCFILSNLQTLCISGYRLEPIAEGSQGRNLRKTCLRYMQPYLLPGNSQRREFSRNHGGSLLVGSMIGSSSETFLLQPGFICPGNSHNDLVLLHQLTIKTSPINPQIHLYLIWTIPELRFLS